MDRNYIIQELQKLIEKQENYRVFDMSEKTIVSFPYKDETLTGTVIRLNRKTVTVETDALTFRVPYSLLTPKLKPPKPKASTQSSKKTKEWSQTQSKDYQKSLSAKIDPLTGKRLKSLHIAVKLLSKALKNGEEEAINEFTNEMIAELNLISINYLTSEYTQEGRGG